jgi:hypothetical protein
LTNTRDVKGYEVNGGGVTQGRSLEELGRQKSGFVMLRDGLNGVVSRMIRLDDDGTSQRSWQCKIDGIEKVVIRSFRGTKIWDAQPSVGLHDTDDADLGNGSAPKEKLGADDNIPLPFLHLEPGGGRQ